MNSILNLAFFKSVGFPTKESGMAFVKENSKLHKEVEVKISEIEEFKSQILDDLKENVFPKYSSKLDVYLVKVKCDKKEKATKNKELQKVALKEEMRAELLAELKAEEYEKKRTKLMKVYADAIPKINMTVCERIPELEEQFIKVLQKLDKGEIAAAELQNIEKMKDQVEKAITTILKIAKSLDKLE